MHKRQKIFVLSCIGGFIGFSIWAIFYFANKTPAIEFDGPAGFVMIAATAFGFLVFGFMGIILTFLKKF